MHHGLECKMCNYKTFKKETGKKEKKNLHGFKAGKEFSDDFRSIIS